MKQSSSDIQKLFSSYPSWKASFPSRRFAPEVFNGLVDTIIARGNARMEEAGRSFEGRPIRVLHAGTGSTTVLLWSQMHGDEPTATMAIADMLNFFKTHSHEEPAETILSAFHLLFVPMLNPDGAARFQRRTAQGIDMNRDAVALVTPEARILKSLQETYRPAFGFNLHDQELSTIGSSNVITAIALLAPAFDEGKSDNDTRRKAKHLASSLAASLALFAPGRIARFDDTFEPRAFGDTMQRSGTSTILVESGHERDDPGKDSIRRLNAVGLVDSLLALATGAYARSDLSAYESLPFNGKKAYDLIIRDARIGHTNGMKTKADLGISYEVETHTGDIPLLVDVGDLSTFVGLREIDGGQRVVNEKSIRHGEAFDWEQFFAR